MIRRVRQGLCLPDIYNIYIYIYTYNYILYISYSHYIYNKI